MQNLGRCTLQEDGGSAPSNLLQWGLDCSEDALAVVDRDFNLVAVNSAWSATFERHAERCAEVLFNDLGVMGLLKTFLAEANSSSDFRHVESSRGRLLIQAWRTSSDEIGGLTVRLTPERKKTQPPPQALAQRLRLAMRMAKVVAFEFDYRTGEGAYDPQDAGPQGLSFRSFEDTLRILPPDIRDEANALWTHHLLTGEIFVLEYQWRHPDGQLGWHMNACEAIKDDQGEVIGLIGMRQDITERKRAELAIIAEREAAKAADNAKSSFLANMSHEIRTPLNGVLAMAQVMAMDELTPAQRCKIDIIRQSGEDLLHILNDVLDFSKIEAGKLELEHIAFDLADVLSGAEASFAAVAERKKLVLRLEIVESARGLRMGDPARLRQIVSNYISNALKFTSAGEICIRASGVGERGHEGLLLSVQDAGEGISPEKMALLFQKFTQLDASTTRQFGGTGLGLAICQELASLMGGRVWAESVQGKGSTFFAMLPLAYVGEEVPTERETMQVDIIGADRTLRVLAAEDNLTNQMVLQTIMGVMGLDVQIVGNGCDAVKAWRDNVFDLILMDVQMPEMDGVTATRVIRAEEAQFGRARTPIIALSANAFSHQVKEYLAAGMDGHVAKPIELTALHSALELALSSGDDDQKATGVAA